MATITLSKPPRLTGETEEQIGTIFQYQEQTYRMIVVLAQALAAVGALAPLAMDATNPPTEAEVQTLADRLDRIVSEMPAIS